MPLGGPLNGSSGSRLTTVTIKKVSLSVLSALNECQQPRVIEWPKLKANLNSGADWSIIKWINDFFSVRMVRQFNLYLKTYWLDCGVSNCF